MTVMNLTPLCLAIPLLSTSQQRVRSCVSLWFKIQQSEPLALPTGFTRCARPSPPAQHCQRLLRHYSRFICHPVVRSGAAIRMGLRSVTGSDVKGGCSALFCVCRCVKRMRVKLYRAARYFGPQ